jgi:hypothetical protein
MRFVAAALAFVLLAGPRVISLHCVPDCCPGDAGDSHVACPMKPAQWAKCLVVTFPDRTRSIPSASVSLTPPAASALLLPGEYARLEFRSAGVPPSWTPVPPVPPPRS